MAQKFRPYLTLDDLTLISSSLKSSNPSSIGLIRYIDTYISQITGGLRRSSYQVSPPKLTLAQSLELEDSPPSPSQESIGEPIESLLSLPRESLSVAQLIRVQDHRYLHNLMTPQEESKYEQANGIIT